MATEYCSHGTRRYLSMTEILTATDGKRKDYFEAGVETCGAAKRRGRETCAERDPHFVKKFTNLFASKAFLCVVCVVYVCKQTNVGQTRCVFSPKASACNHTSRRQGG